VAQGALRGMLIVLALALPRVGAASQCAGPDQDLSCPGRQRCVRVERRPCPPAAKRPLFYRRAACCEDPRTERLLERLRRIGRPDKVPVFRVRCSHFSHCPSRSPS
jgi:hypothetical protein